AVGAGGWRLVGLSFGAGRLTRSVDGRARLGKSIGDRGALPFGGRLLLGGKASGQVDEVAVYDVVLPAARLLDRLHVARGLEPASPLPAELPLRVVAQSGHRRPVTDLAWS